jgi:hypothetical protein
VPSWNFRNCESKFTRGFLGLSAKKPITANCDDFEKAGNGWENAETKAVERVQHLANVILDGYKDELGTEETVNNAISILADLSAKLEGDFKATLGQLLFGEEPHACEELRDEAVSPNGKVQTFWERHDIASSLDVNEFVLDLTVVAPVLEHLGAMQSALRLAA